MHQPMLCLLYLNKRTNARPRARAHARLWRSAFSGTTGLGQAYIQMAQCCHYWKAHGKARYYRYEDKKTISPAARQRRVSGHRGVPYAPRKRSTPKILTQVVEDRAKVVSTDHTCYNKEWLCGTIDEDAQIPSAMVGEKRKHDCLPGSMWTELPTADSSPQQAKPTSQTTCEGCS